MKEPTPVRKPSLKDAAAAASAGAQDGPELSASPALEEGDMPVESAEDLIARGTADLRATVTTLDARVDGLDAKLDHILNALSGMNARDRGGVRVDHGTDVRELEDAQLRHGNNAAEMGAFDSEIIRPTIADVDNPVFKRKAEQLRFNEDWLIIELQPSSDRDRPNRFDIQVNGDPVVFEYNATADNRYRVRRKHVEVMIRAQPMGFSSEEHTRPNGERYMKYPAHRGFRYPVSIIEDPAGQAGREWLRRVRASA